MRSIRQPDADGGKSFDRAQQTRSGKHLYNELKTRPMKRFILLILIASCLLGCEKTHENPPETVPTRYICEECIRKDIIHDCSCEKEGCQCYDIPSEILHKYDDDKDVIMILVASVKVRKWDENDVYSLPDGYLVTYPHYLWEFGWSAESIKDFPYEKGYEYLIYIKQVQPCNDCFFDWHYLETVSKTKIQSFNLPESADEY